MSFCECRVGDGGMGAGQSKFVAGEDGDEVLEGNGSGRRKRVFFSVTSPALLVFLPFDSAPCQVSVTEQV